MARCHLKQSNQSTEHKHAPNKPKSIGFDIIVNLPRDHHYVKLKIEKQILRPKYVYINFFFQKKLGATLHLVFIALPSPILYLKCLHTSLEMLIKCSNMLSICLDFYFNMVHTCSQHDSNEHLEMPSNLLQT